MSEGQLYVAGVDTEISKMKEKAEQSEVMVQEFCRDIKKLEFSKKHITTTITARHRLAMLAPFCAFSSTISSTLEGPRSCLIKKRRYTTVEVASRWCS